MSGRNTCHGEFGRVTLALHRRVDAVVEIPATASMPLGSPASDNYGRIRDKERDPVAEPVTVPALSRPLDVGFRLEQVFVAVGRFVPPQSLVTEYGVEQLAVSASHGPQIKAFCLCLTAHTFSLRLSLFEPIRRRRTHPASRRRPYADPLPGAH